MRFLGTYCALGTALLLPELSSSSPVEPEVHWPWHPWDLKLFRYNLPSGLCGRISGGSVGTVEDDIPPLDENPKKEPYKFPFEGGYCYSFLTPATALSWVWDGDYYEYLAERAPGDCSMKLFTDDGCQNCITSIPEVEDDSSMGYGKGKCYNGFGASFSSLSVTCEHEWFDH